MGRTMRGIMPLSAALAFAAALPGASEVVPGKSEREPVQIGDPARDFALKDADGREFRLSSLLEEQAGKAEKDRVKAIVLTFWSYNCGTSKKYAPRIKAFVDGHKNNASVRILGINSNSTETAEKSKERLTETKTDLRLLIDPDGIVARSFGAECNTTTVVLDGKGVLRYWGSIDNNKDVGEEGRKACLRDATAALLEGREVAEKKTAPFG